MRATGFQPVGRVADGIVAASVGRRFGVFRMTTPQARAALVEVAVAALACAALPTTHATFRDVIGPVAQALAMDRDDSLHALRNAALDWAQDARAWPRVVAALRDIYVARGTRHLAALGLGATDAG